MRLFVAIPLPEQNRFVLCLKTGIQPPVNTHLTLRFIGETPDARPYLRALGNIRQAPLILVIKNIFQLKKNLVAAKVVLSPELGQLKLKIDMALQSSGLSPESRKFLPHITLSRHYEMRDSRETAYNDFWEADAFFLYQSILKPSGAIHDVLGRFDFHI